MQTILGANGIIGTELAKNLRDHHTDAIRLVGRNPERVHPEDELFKADLMDAAQTAAAVKGSEIAYLTVGLPYNSKVWRTGWPTILRNVIAACSEHQVKLVYFDNTYMYGATGGKLTENTPFAPIGEKGRGKAEAAQLLLTAMEKGDLTAMICRAPEFYGPKGTNSITNVMVLSPLKAGKKARFILSADTLRTLIFTPDASAATALLGNTPDAYGQSWHLPCAEERLTYRQIVELSGEILGRPTKYSVLKKWMLQLVAIFNPNVKETLELLPRYLHDNLFDSSKFKQRFPNFKIKTLSEGLRRVLLE